MHRKVLLGAASMQASIIESKAWIYLDQGGQHLVEEAGVFYVDRIIYVDFIKKLYLNSIQHEL